MWSDDESSASKLKSDYDYLTKPERTISEIMSRAALLLAKEVCCSSEKSMSETIDINAYAVGIGIK